jgi:hypothetical protein
MELKFVTATSRSAVVELTESGKFYTEKTAVNIWTVKRLLQHFTV